MTAKKFWKLIKRVQCWYVGHTWFEIYRGDGDFVKNYIKKAKYCSRCTYWKPEI